MVRGRSAPVSSSGIGALAGAGAVDGGGGLDWSWVLVETLPVGLFGESILIIRCGMIIILLV